MPPLQVCYGSLLPYWVTDFYHFFFCTFVCFHDQKAAGGEIGKREKARLREMQKLKKQKIHEILSAQNAAIDADMVFCWKDCSFCRLDYFK